MRMRKNVNKKIDKLVKKKCTLCDVQDVELLEYHRIKYGKDGGTYNYNNTFLVCSNCHTKIHKDKIFIDGWYESTNGRVVFVKLENGEERIISD